MYILPNGERVYFKSEYIFGGCRGVIAGVESGAFRLDREYVAEDGTSSLSGMKGESYLRGSRRHEIRRPRPLGDARAQRRSLGRGRIREAGDIGRGSGRRLGKTTGSGLRWVVVECTGITYESEKFEEYYKGGT
eukprot:226453-Amorphochlora_amoeboformis.AAC.2